MQFLKALFGLLIAAALGSPAAIAQMRFGPEGAEGEPNRMQRWLVPSPEPGIAAHALLFRPSGEGPFPLALIAHASTRTCCVGRKCRSLNTARLRHGWWRGALRCWCRNGLAMARPAENISKTRAAAMKPIIHAPGAPPQPRSPQRFPICAGNPLSGRTGR